MDSFKHALGGMAHIPQFFIWRLEWDGVESKYKKIPCAHDGSAYAIDASLPANWTNYDTAQAIVETLRATAPADRTLTYAIGWWMTPGCGYWFYDLDGVVVDGALTPIASAMIAAFPNAMVEFSSSRRGVHIFGSGNVPEHSTRPPAELRRAGYAWEFYTSGRGIAFGLDGKAQGCADARYDMAEFVARYFPKAAISDLSDGRRPEWRGPADDDVLIERMLKARLSAAAAFGNKTSLPDLWAGNAPHTSESDMALLSHLAFWCGCDAERMIRLMWRSGLKRDKWTSHRTYLTLSAENAIAGCSAVYQEPVQASPTIGEEGTASATSDLANARRLANHHGKDMMNVPGIGWHVWEGNGPWQHDDGKAQKLAFGLGKIIQAEADALEDWANDETILGSDEQKRRKEIQKTLGRWARSSEFVVSVRHTLEAAQTMLTVKADQLDASPMLVGTPSGVIDLSTCTQREHRREDRITKRVACDYDPTARAPLWDSFVHRVMGGDAELIAYLQTLCGYMLSGQRGEHALPVLHGSGANGKSTFLATIQTLMGDYAGTASPGLLLARKDSDQLAAIAALRGLRLVVVSESGETERLDESRVKQITGGDRLTGRPLYQNFIEFTPTHIAVLQSNHRPRVNGTDDGIWRRLKLVPFAQTIPAAERDPELAQKLRAENAGILAWMVEGFRMYQRQGFKEPEAVRMATQDYRSASDAVGQFINERCNVGPEYTATATQIYMAYKIWCAEHGENCMTQRALGLKLSERGGIESVRTTSARSWRGLGIASYAELGQLAGQVIPLARKG